MSIYLGIDRMKIVRIMIVFCMSWAVVLCNIHAADNTTVLPKFSVQYHIPVLTVDGTGVGNCTRIPIHITHENTTSPFRIALSEDMPGGSGDMLRSSIWTAAITVALARQMDMHGCRVSIDFAGNIDGPSAGALVCLAILSGFDQRSFPADFAITGTIMPDGTIGPVGGVANKITAAAKNGIKRICIPAFIRFETQDNGEIIDLYRHAESLVVRLYPAESITNAYSIMHNIPEQTAKIPSHRDVCQFPKLTEDILAAAYKEIKKTVTLNFSNLSPELQEQCASDDFSPQRGGQAFATGYLLTAVYESLGSLMMISSIKLEHYKPDFSKPYQDKQKRKETLIALFKEIDKKLATVVDTHEKDSATNGYYPKNDWVKDSSAQLEEPELLALVLSLYMAADITGLESSDDITDEMLDQYIEKAFVKTKLVNFLCECDKAQSLFETIISAQPQAVTNKKIAEVTSLFNRAWTAVDNTLRSECLSPMSTRLSVSMDQLSNLLLVRDQSYGDYYFSTLKAQEMYNLYKKTVQLRNTNYHAVATLCMQVSQLVKAHALYVKYEMLDYNEERNTYGNMALLNYLIRSARDRALANIGECRKKDIPCPAAISWFESAELCCFDAASDRVHDVLSRYWMASLYAQALSMSFSAN